MPNIAETEYFFTSSEGKTPIHVREWTPDCDLNGVVQISHGINEYIGRYEDFARYLASKALPSSATTTSATAGACSPPSAWATSPTMTAGSARLTI